MERRRQIERESKSIAVLFPPQTPRKLIIWIESGLGKGVPGFALDTERRFLDFVFGRKRDSGES